MSSPQISSPVLRAAVALAVVGVIASLWVHIASFSGFSLPLAAQIVSAVGLSGAFGPVITAVILRAEDEIGPIVPGEAIPNPKDMVRRAVGMTGWMLRFLPRGERAAFVLLLVYTLVQWILGIRHVVASPDAEGFPLSMMSALALYFFGFSVLYGRRLLRAHAGSG